MNDQAVFCLMGPTACGKTALACELITRFPFEIISVDSAMIYRGMDIGSAKPSKQTLLESPHHLIDILNPIDTYSAALFCSDVTELCKAIFARGHIPLLVGGTMMYFNALQQGLSLLPEACVVTRASLELEAQQKGWDYLHERLKKVDPISAKRIHPHDAQRIARALEVHQLTQKPLSDFFSDMAPKLPYRFVNIGLMPQDRSWLHQRIELRFHEMMAQGFLDEVRQLVRQWQLNPQYPSMRSVGYRQALGYLQGEYDFANFLAKGLAATRQLAKRQITWLRSWPECIMLCAEETQISYKKVISCIQKTYKQSSLNT